MGKRKQLFIKQIIKTKKTAMKKYNLVIESTPQALIETVNVALSHGYYPKGGVILIEGKLIQAIYLRDKESELKESENENNPLK